MKLNKCPCGKTPSRLLIAQDSECVKYADVSGDCCDDWATEVRLDYSRGSEAYDKAVESWNRAPREVTK